MNLDNCSSLEALRLVAARDDVSKILEIGSSTGVGSTRALIEGVSSKDDLSHVKIFGFELFSPHFEQLCVETKAYSFFHPLNMSTIALDEFPPFAQVREFYYSVDSNLKKLSIEDVSDLYDRTLEYMRSRECHHNGIKLLKLFYGINVFDLVYIDGSEFSGLNDFFSTFGAKFIALDDINTFKCYDANIFLRNCALYKNIYHDNSTGNGSAIFMRKW